MCRSLVVPILLLALLLGACNVGPFGGSAHLTDSSGKHVWTGDGAKAKLSHDMTWDFVRIRSQIQWAAGKRTWDPSGIISQCERARPTRLVAQSAPGEQLTVSETRTIVCIDPPVVIVSPSPRTVPTLRAETTDHGKPALFKFGRATFELANGYLYGTHVERRDDLTWFSPSLAPEPRPLMQNGRPTPIELPAGRLIFNERSRRLDVRWAATD